ncbi:MAG TPA: invasion associated locus B family protein [Xanthobacteraceae bacterium]|nr:invasion associated locus B family protein [Xanthobacteraceae bacterium]
MFARRARVQSAYRTGLPLALAIIMSVMTVALAQQATDDQDQPAAKAKPVKKKKAVKSDQPDQTAEPKTDAKPPAKKKKASPAPATTAAVPTPGGGQPTLIAQYGDWGAYMANAGGRTVCYALAKPATQATQPPNRPRDPAYMFISTRPAENVRNEISIVIGYPFKPGFEASADIGANKYAMYTQGDGAWVKNPAEEARMVDAMRKGADLVVTGESGKGTKSTDRYTLKGLSQALDRVAAECK